ELVQRELAARTPWLVLHAVRLLHECGFHQLRVLPGLSPSGVHWRVTISPTHVPGADGQADFREHARVIRYTTGSPLAFADGEVTLATPPEEVAELILRALPHLSPVPDDPEYVHWFAELLELAEREGHLPIAYADEFDDAE